MEEWKDEDWKLDYHVYCTIIIITYTRNDIYIYIYIYILLYNGNDSLPDLTKLQESSHEI